MVEAEPAVLLTKPEEGAEWPVEFEDEKCWPPDEQENKNPEKLRKSRKIKNLIGENDAAKWRSVRYLIERDLQAPENEGATRILYIER